MLSGVPMDGRSLKRARITPGWTTRGSGIDGFRFNDAMLGRFDVAAT